MTNEEHRRALSTSIFDEKWSTSAPQRRKEMSSWQLVDDNDGKDCKVWAMLNGPNTLHNEGVSDKCLLIQRTNTTTQIL